MHEYHLCCKLDLPLLADTSSFNVYYSRIPFAQQIKDDVSGLLVEDIVLLYDLVELPLDLFLVSSELHPALGTSVLLFLYDIQGGALGTIRMLHRITPTVQGKTVLAFSAKHIQHTLSYYSF